MLNFFQNLVLFLSKEIVAEKMVFLLWFGHISSIDIKWAIDSIEEKPNFLLNNIINFGSRRKQLLSHLFLDNLRLTLYISSPEDSEDNLSILDQDVHKKFWEALIIKIKTDILDGISEKASLIIE